MKQIVDQLNKIAKKIDANVDIPNTDLITDSLDAITTALGGTPNDSNLIVDKLEDIAGVAHGGGGGGDSPVVYIKVNITNADTTYDLYDYDGNNTNPSLQSYFKDGDGTRISPYFTTTNGQINNLTAGSGNIVATKNGGTGIIYLIPTSCEKYINGSWTNIKEFQIGKTEFCTELTSVDNVTITDDGYIYYFKLTDDTKIGEVNATLVGYIPD